MSEEILSPHDALVYIMVLVSAADQDMTDRELRRIGDQVRSLPVFAEFDPEDLVPVTQDCAALLQRDDGLEKVLERIVASLPARLAETAYAIACEIAAADLEVEPEEVRILQLLRQHLRLDKLASAAIERAARARNLKL